MYTVRTLRGKLISADLTEEQACAVADRLRAIGTLCIVGHR